jgi:hypothetical protein
MRNAGIWVWLHELRNLALGHGVYGALKLLGASFKCRKLPEN